MKPCVDEPDLYTAHGELGVEVDIEALEEKLPKNSTCVPGLGVARFELRGKEVTLYGDGSFDSRRVEDLEDAEELAEELLDLASA